jgi:EAL and modified HD-GYP domain-containing signal transduction protein
MEQKMIDIYVGRQPVYTPSMDIFGYELLYRAKENTKALLEDGEKASSQVIFNTFIELGIDKIIEDKLAFLQVDRVYLTGKVLLPFPKEQAVMCIPPWVQIDDELLVSLEIMHNAGHWLALEDHPDLELTEPLVRNINILKLNIHQYPLSSLRDRVLEYRRFPSRLLADHVQTQEEYDACRELGIDFFQGNFLSQPKLIHGRRLPARRFSLLKLLTCLYDPDVDMRELEELIRQDVSLSYRLLRMVNSAYYALDTKVESIRHALVILGLKQIRAWLTILAMSEVNDRSNTLMTTAMIRGKMCELLAQSMGYKQEDRFFTVGLLSILDAIMDLPMTEVLQSLPMTDDINQALLKHTGPLGELLGCVIDYENGDWNAVESAGLSSIILRDSYLASIAWASEISHRIQI